MAETFYELGRRLVRESREPAESSRQGHVDAREVVGYGADDLDDDAVLQVLIGALDEVDVTDEGELWWSCQGSVDTLL